MIGAFSVYGYGCKNSILKRSHFCFLWPVHLLDEDVTYIYFIATYYNYLANILSPYKAEHFSQFRDPCKNWPFGTFFWPVERLCWLFLPFSAIVWLQIAEIFAGVSKLGKVFSFNLNCYSDNFPTPALSNCQFMCSFLLGSLHSTCKNEQKNDILNGPGSRRSESYLKSSLYLNPIVLGSLYGPSVLVQS
jgi:hypothetical protein